MGFPLCVFGSLREPSPVWFNRITEQRPHRLPFLIS